MVQALKRLYHFLVGIQTYRSYPLVGEPSGKGEKTLFVDLEKNPYRRYLYILLKFFQMEGYRIYLPKAPALIGELRSNPYANLLLKEQMVRFGSPPITDKTIVINRESLSPDYYRELLNRAPSPSSYHVPMSLHPLMYHKGLWNKPLAPAGPRKRTLFMIGNFDPKKYRQIEKDGIFKVASRLKIYEHLENGNTLCRIQTPNALSRFLQSEVDGKVLLIKRSDFAVPMERLREMLGHFAFYFALPGMVIPFSHNVIEAMSVGTIPFLQENYAALFRPALKHGVNAITFHDLEDMDRKISRVFELKEEEVIGMRERVHRYYQQFLTPEAVVKSFEDNRFDRIFLQAEHNSVRLVKKHRRRSF